MNLPIYYLYKLTHKVDNTFYFGSRACKDAAYFNRSTLDLGTKYKSSSQTIKKIGFDNFNYEIIKQDFSNSDDCYWAEQDLIKEHIHNPLCLNKHFKDSDSHSIFSTTGTTLSETHKKAISASQKGRPRTPAQIAAVRQRNKQTKLDNISKYDATPSVCKVCNAALPYHKRTAKTCCKECYSMHQSSMAIAASTPEHRQKLSDSRKKVVYTEEWRQNISKAHTGKAKSELTKEKMRHPKGPNPGTALYRKTAPKSPCPHCTKLLDAALMKRWHGDKCKNKNVS